MAGENGREAVDVRKAILENSRSFSFFQAVRLLNKFMFNKDATPESGEVLAKGIRIRPNLSLSFPTCDIDSIDEIDDSVFQITANILGLYGTCSPLPTYYTEDLFADEDGEISATRAFLDVINQRLYELLFAGWSKYRSMLKVVEENATDHTDRLFSMIGLGASQLRKDDPFAKRLLRYSGLLSLPVRSAKGLETMLRDTFGHIDITIIQAIERKSIIPEDQRAKLGGMNLCLGQNAHLGFQYKDRASAFRIEIGPLSEKQYRSFFPGTKEHHLLLYLTEFYVNDPLVFDIEVVLDKRVKPGNICLGDKRWTGLGLDSWLFAGEIDQQVRTRFYPERLSA